MPITREQTPTTAGLDEILQRLDREHRCSHIMTAEAAELIGVSRLTLMRWRRQGRLEPTRVMVRGQQQFPLYTNQDIEKGRELRGTIPHGPAPGTKKKGKVNHGE